jgi:hypothetical protein
VDGQLEELDPADPVTYRSTATYMSPLPLDHLVALNEIQMEMMLGLESKTGALKKLGEMYPAEKLQELIEELHQDALEQGALDMLNAFIDVLIEMQTGVSRNPEGSPQASEQPTAGNPGQGQDVQSAGGPGVNSPTQAGVLPQPGFMEGNKNVEDIMNQLTTLAAGTKLPQIRNPAKAST